MLTDIFEGAWFGRNNLHWETRTDNDDGRQAISTAPWIPFVCMGSVVVSELGSEHGVRCNVLKVRDWLFGVPVALDPVVRQVTGDVVLLEV